ncbi:MAG: ThuA domain-containing protein, partial [Verrucomicrobiales bacterium]
MKRLPLVIPLFVLSILTAATHLPGADSEKNPAPIRALLITGGCCHDYETQKENLSAGISERAE